MSADAPIGVALVEDDETTRQRLVQALAGTPRIELRLAAADARQILDWLGTNRVDVLLVDLGLPDRSGLDVIRWCRQHQPAAEVMVVTMFGDEANMIQAFEAGAHGYLLKDGSEADLARHVLALHSGGSPMTPLIARQLLERLPASTGAPPASPLGATALISTREQQLLQMLARGYTYAEAAQLLGVTHSTVQSHVKSIYSKLSVHSKTEAIFEARQMGLL